MSNEIKKFEIEDVNSALKKVADDNKVTIVGAYTIQPLIQVRDLEGKPVDDKLYQKVLEGIRGVETSYEINFVVEPRLSIMTKNEPIDAPKEEAKENKKAESTKA